VKQIDLSTLRNVLQGVEVNVVEAGQGELRLFLADGDKVTVRAVPSYDPALQPDLQFFLDSARGAS
jgi:hypothetical protein